MARVLGLAKLISVIALLVVAPGSVAVAGSDGHWASDNATGCTVWVSDSVTTIAVEWDGPCRNGRAHGKALWSGDT